MIDEKHKLEINAKFFCTMVFVTSHKEFMEMEFQMPMGVYPDPEWLPDLMKECSREALKALKLQTKNLSWRKPTVGEFIEYTTGELPDFNKFEDKWQEPYSAQLELSFDDKDADKIILDPTESNDDSSN